MIRSRLVHLATRSRSGRRPITWRCLDVTRLRALRSFASESGKNPHGLFAQQLRELNDEREALFGHTPEDYKAWTNASNHQHDESFLNAVNTARDEQAHALPEQQVDDSAAAEDRALHSDTPFDRQQDVSTGLTHLTCDGSSIRMVDVGTKAATSRVAIAQATMYLPSKVIEALTTLNNVDTMELVGPKGPIFATAKLAGIMAAKRTSDLIPLCHPLPLDQINIDIQLVLGNTILIQCECKVTHKTGVEMEALMGVSIAALTIYDMVKAISHEVRIVETKLVSKRGGKRLVKEDGETIL